MSRPRGSKNKVEEVKVVEVPKEKEVVKEVIKEVFPACRDFNCSHSKEMHYGPKTDWCNTTGCKCQTYLK